MSALAINLRQNIEEKWLDVEVESLVVEEQFCQQTQVLTVQLQHSSATVDEWNLLRLFYQPTGNFCQNADDATLIILEPISKINCNNLF